MPDETDTQPPTWEQLELLVADIQKQLAPDAKVLHNVKLTGILSETERQIDVLVEQNIGQYVMRVVIDCKDYSSPVDVKGVEEFHGLMKDVKAHKGALVCPKGFTRTAKTRARKLQIELYSPVDTDPHKWTVSVSAPVVCDFRNTYMGFGIRYSQPYPFRMPEDFWNLDIFDENERPIGTILECAQRNWDSGKYPYDVGGHEDLPIYFDGKTLMDNGYDTLVEADLTVRLLIKRQLYYGTLPITKIRGLKDEQTGAIVTNAFTTGVLDSVEVQNTWRKIEEEEELPAPPLMTVIGLDCYGYGA